MCVVVPHLLPKGGSGAAPLLDTPAHMIRFRLELKGARSFPHHANVEPLDHSQRRLPLSLATLRPRGFRAPGPSSRAWRLPLSTCTEPWMTCAVRSLESRATP
jgi:hypothetical protein